jgi:hypothetical protein
MGHTTSPTTSIGTSSVKTFPVINFSNNFSTSKSSSFFEKAGDYYNQWNLQQAGLAEDAFKYALKGYDYLVKCNQVQNKNIITIVDFSKPSTEKRLYVLDVRNGKILYHTLVAHGRNSGNQYATKFSNQPESHQSSLGFYVTSNTYRGSHGYSLRLKGCEKGINDKACERAIVVHGADYVSNSFVNSHGYLGRSYGCPSLPAGITKEIIDVIKQGSCLFMYHPSRSYSAQSKIINS